MILLLWAGGALAGIDDVSWDGTFTTSEWSGLYTNGNNMKGTSSSVSPSGGEKYDVEFVALSIDQNESDLTQGTVSFALQTGFSFEGGRYYNNSDHLETGDLAFDLDMDGDFDAAIRFSTAFTWHSYNNGSGHYTYNKDDIQFISRRPDEEELSWDGTTYYPWVGNYRVDENSGKTSSFAPTAIFAYGVEGSPNWVEKDPPGWGNRFGEDKDRYNNHVIEGQFDLALLTEAGLNLGDAVTLKWTMECGNDYLSHTATTLAAGGTPPGGGAVPEPTTALLLGIGLAGFAATRRRRFKT